jgi:hypothetical protein
MSHFVPASYFDKSYAIVSIGKDSLAATERGLDSDDVSVDASIFDDREDGEDENFIRGRLLSLHVDDIDMSVQCSFDNSLSNDRTEGEDDSGYGVSGSGDGSSSSSSSSSSSGSRTGETGNGIVDTRTLSPLDTAKDLISFHGSELDLLFEVAGRKFNVHPHSAYAYLVERGAIRENAADFAKFLFEYSRVISKRRIGEFIGKENEFNQQVCAFLFSFYSFKDQPFDVALRMLMRSFRLPGEAQQIDRILQKFAQSFHKQNPRILRSADTGHVLAFSLMMLNTDLHNPAVAPEKKMTLSQFLHNNRGIDEGQDIDAAYLEALYTRIKSNEIRMNEMDQFESENVAFMAPKLSSWLLKKSSNTVGSKIGLGNKMRWFTLSDGCLYYFKNQQASTPRGIIPLDNASITTNPNDPCGFILSSASGGSIKSSKLRRGNMAKGRQRGFKLFASSESDRSEWVSVLREEASRFLPLHEVFLKLRQKKAQMKHHSQEKSLALVMPLPLVRGWMRKRGGGTSSWRRRYFSIFPDFDGGGPTLFYYLTKEACVSMMEKGVQTQNGYLRLLHIRRVDLIVDDAPIPYLNVYIGTSEEVSWTFVPETEVEGYGFLHGLHAHDASNSASSSCDSSNESNRSESSDRGVSLLTDARGVGSFEPSSSASPDNSDSHGRSGEAEVEAETNRSLDRSCSQDTTTASPIGEYPNHQEERAESERSVSMPTTPARSVASALSADSQQSLGGADVETDGGSAVSPGSNSSTLNSPFSAATEEEDAHALEQARRIAKCKGKSVLVWHQVLSEVVDGHVLQKE